MSYSDVSKKYYGQRIGLSILNGSNISSFLGSLWTKLHGSEKKFAEKKETGKHLCWSSLSHPRLNWGCIGCKYIARWQHLSQIKATLLWPVENVFSPIKTQQATSGTNAATYKLMEPHWTQSDVNATLDGSTHPGWKILIDKAYFELWKMQQAFIRDQ